MVREHGRAGGTRRLGISVADAVVLRVGRLRDFAALVHTAAWLLVLNVVNALLVLPHPLASRLASRLFRRLFWRLMVLCRVAVSQRLRQKRSTSALQLIITAGCSAVAALGPAAASML